MHSSLESSDVERTRDLLGLQKRLVEDYEGQVRRLEARLNALSARQQWFENTRSWKITAPLRVASRIVRALTAQRAQVAAIARELPTKLLTEGLDSGSWVQRRVAQLDCDERHAEQLRRILEHHRGKPVLVTYPRCDWNVPLFQRPHQLMLQFAARGFLVFFVTENQRYDEVDGFEEVASGCFVTNQNDLLLLQDFSRILYLCSTALSATIETVEQAHRRGDRVLYDFIDEMHDDLGAHIPPTLRALHRYVLQDKRVVVLATADRLADEVRAVRREHWGLITNGVDPVHFARRPDAPHSALKALVRRGKPIVGYYGALANWLDYELVGKVASQMSDLEFVLIGPRYDTSASGAPLHTLSNVTVLPPIPYQELPTAAQYFSVAMVPFRLNDVTLSTSPIKIFEYMSLGLPIVSTELPECRKYQSVLVARSVDEFQAHVARALELREDPKYRSLLAQEAQVNSWAAKVERIEMLMKEAWGMVLPAQPQGVANAGSGQVPTRGER